MEVRYAAQAVTNLDALPQKIAQRIVKKIGWYADTKNPFVFAKRLTGEWGHLYRFRIGEYRAIFAKEQDGSLSLLLILSVKHRREVYD